MEETYTVTELTSIDGYGKATAVETQGEVVNGVKEFTYTLTNTHTPAVVFIPVTVEWIDDSNRDGLRPENGSVIKLYKQVEGEEKTTLVKTQNVVSTYSFTDLPQYENGKKITYTVTQDNVANYTTTDEHTKNDQDVITEYKFINTHTPETKDVTVSKTWKDGNNAESSRKDVTVILSGGDENLEAILTSENGYTHTFKNLFVKKGGQTIKYSIQEKEVPTNYTPQYSSDGLSVTNVYKQGVNISKTVTKIWEDNGNVDNSRPDSVTVNLLANGQVLEGKSVQLTASNNWTSSWDELPEYDTEGAKITYTAQEATVGNGYTPSYSNDTFTITNSRPQDTRDVTVTKKWVGDSHVSRLVRPEKITVQLYANGTPVGDTKDITGSDDVDTWTATWNNMPTNYLKDGVSTPIEYTVAEVGTYNDYNPEIRGLTITNTYVPVKITRTVNKVWADDNNHDGKQPKTIKVKLTGTVGNISQVVYEEEVTLGDNGWQHIFNNLPRFVENGENKGAEITYTVTETPVAGYETDIDTAGNVTTITNSRANALKDIVVTKVWNDDSNRDRVRPDDITIQLKRDGVAFGAPVTLTSENVSATAANTWTYTFSNLEVYGNVNAETKEVTPYVFTVDEVTTSNDYSKNVSEDNMSGEGDATVTITNTHEIETVDFEVEKVWEDFENNDGVRPTSIEVVLKANGAEYKKVTLNSANRWQHTWGAIPKNADGEPINYTVEELTLPKGYTSGTQYSDITNGKKATITNTYSNKEQKQVRITKVWNNEEENHPERPTSVTVDVKRGNDVVTTVTLKAEEDWTKTISLDKLYRGNEAVYTVVETNVKSGYTPSYPTAIVNNDGILEYTIKNTYNVTKKSFTVTKEWNDNNNQDGVRPPSIQVQLFKNGQVEGSPVTIIPSENVWTYTWPALETSRDGHENVYSVQEVGPIVGYTPASTTPVVFDQTGNATLINNHTLEKTSLTVTKVWNDNDDNDDIRPDSIQVQLYKNNVEYGAPVTLTDNKLTHTWTDLDKNANGTAVTYTVKEVNVPEGYASNAAEPIEFDSNNEATITNTHGKDKIKLTIKKLWAGDSETNNERPASITVKLYADGQELQTVTLLKSENWTKEVTVDKKNNKRNISYTLKEVTKTSGYTLTDSNTVSGQDGELTVTNTYNVTKKSYTVTKSWDDANNQDGIRPTSIMVQLFKNHVAEGAPVEVKAIENWTYTWSNLEVSRDGNENVYTVKEVVPTGYTSSASEEVSFNEAGNVTITNTHLPEKTGFTVAKEWVDDNDNDGMQPQSIQVQLYKGTEPCGQPVTLSARNQWTYEWTNLDKKENGVDIVYNVAEVNVPEGYKDSIVYSENHLSALITNTHEKNKIKLTIEKAWAGDTEENNERPEYVDVNLYAGETAIRTVRLTAENNWTAEVEEFQRFNKQDIVYSLAEVTHTSGYTATYSNPVSGADGRLTVTNTYNVEKANYTVTKSWDDANNQDGKRPTSIKVQLYKNNVVFGDEVTITKDDKWTYTWTGLETKRDNDTFTYTVKEVEGPNGYESDAVEEAISFDNDNKAVITNTHEVAKTRFTVTKVWEDNDNNDNIRPESIQVKLFANGNDTGKSVTLTDNKLSDTWSDLDVYANGQLIEYTVQEVGVPTGYTSNTVYSTDKTSATITNTHTKNTIKLTITKAWAGDSETNNERPASVEVKLLADGEYLQTVTLTAAENWTKEVTVDQKLNKQDISYELVEVTKTSGYTPTYSDPVSGQDGELIVTNTYNVIKKSFTVTKDWKDVDNQDGKRPTSIWVQLLKNGQAEGRLVEVKAIENWTYTWYDLETSRDGNTNTYTVQEVGTIDGYTSNAIEPVSFDNDGRVTITNTHKPARTSFSVEKVWVDDNNQDGLRPDSVTIRFFRDNEEIATSMRTLTKGNWTAYLGTMDDYTNGVKHVYKVVEDSVKGYVATYKYDEKTGKFTVTNTHTSSKISPTVKFVWDDVNNAEGIRPTSMDVTIKGTVKETVDGEEVDKIVENHTITVSNSTWTDGWTNLPEFYNGQKIFYTVEQAATPDKYTYVGTDTTSTEATFVITNKYVPMVDKTITVIWDDNNDNNKKRPTEVEIQPIVDGKPEGEPIKVNVKNNKDEEDDNKWTTTVTLPKYDDKGKEIEYKVSQNEVPKYETSYSEDTLTITNKYVPDPVIIIPTNPPLKPLEPTVEPTEEPTVEPSEEPTEDVTVVPTENPNAPGDSEDEVRDDDSKEEVVKPETSKHLQAPVTSDKDTTDAQTGNDDTPKTSDDNNMMLYCLYMLLSASGIVVVYSRKRKNKA